MRDDDGGQRRRRRSRQEFAGQAAELGALLADVRAAKGFSLRGVEEATGKHSAFLGARGSPRHG